jgi:hypothetical protein
LIEFTAIGINKIKDASHLQHSALLFSCVFVQRLVSIRIALLEDDVLAFLAFAVFTAFQTCLVAFTVFLKAVGLLAVAALDVLIIFDFLAKGIWIPVHKGHDRIVPFLFIDIEVVAANAIAPIARLVESEAITVEL